MSGVSNMEVKYKEEYDALKNLINVMGRFFWIARRRMAYKGLACDVDVLVATLLASEGRRPRSVLDETPMMPTALTKLLNHMYVGLADGLYYYKIKDERKKIDFILGVAQMLDEFIREAARYYEKLSPLKADRLKELAAFFLDEVAKIERAYIWEKEKLRKFDDFEELSDEIRQLIESIINIKKRSRNPCRFAARVLERFLLYLREKDGEKWPCTVGLE